MAALTVRIDQVAALREVMQSTDADPIAAAAPGVAFAGAVDGTVAALEAVICTRGVCRGLGRVAAVGGAGHRLPGAASAVAAAARRAAWRRWSPQAAKSRTR